MSGRALGLGAAVVVLGLAWAGTTANMAWATTGPGAPPPPPRLQPLPPPAQVNGALAELGRHLYFEPRLSGDGSRSCASCHEPARGWSDGLPLARGYNGTEYFRNAPGLLSVRLKARLNWDGRLDGGDLPTAVRDMVTEAHFMNADARLVQERVRQIPQVMALWRRAFGDMKLSVGVQNAFNRDLLIRAGTSASLGYLPVDDPRLRRYSLNLEKRF